MGHHTDTVANVNPIKAISGKKVVLFMAVGSVVFAAVMGFGTFFLAKLMTPVLERHSLPSSAKGLRQHTR